MAWTSGQQLQAGKYRIEQELGKGGFGITYLARSQEYGKVVIKTLNDQVQMRHDFDTFQNDFFDEALKIRGCQHRHIVRVHKVFLEKVRHPNPGKTRSHSLRLACIVMDYIDGTDLAMLVTRKRRLPEADALRYIQQVGQALSVVHGQGLLHRDVKPNNIMVRRHTDEAVLIDFGIAREFTPSLTRKHTPFLTDGYAPVEQYQPQAKRGAFTDVYALAATLYSLVTGEVPPLSLARRVSLAESRPDELVPPQQKNPAISDRVNAAIMKGMAIQSDYRPQSMAEWLRMLELSPHAGPTTVPPQPGSPVSNQQTPIVAPGPNHRPGLSRPPKTKPKSIQNPPPQSPFSAALTPSVAPRIKHRPASPPASPVPKPAAVAKKGAASVKAGGRDRRQILKWLGLGSAGVLLTWAFRPNAQSDGEEQGAEETIELLLQRMTLKKEAVEVDDQGTITNTYPVTVDAFVEDLGNGVTFTMVQIPTGTFEMGQTAAEKQELIRLVGEDTYQRWYTRELPRHQVTVPSFFMGMMTVTQAVYEAVMGTNPATAYDADRFVNLNKPVVGVSWNDAEAFCQKLSERTQNNYRLPSEAEWEYACRAETTSPFHFGPTLTTDIANYDGNFTYGYGPKGDYQRQTAPVGSFPPNAFGLYDMHGNVLEWCADHWHKNYEGAPSDGSAWLENTLQSNNRRVFRGGSWIDHPRYCRSAYRNHYSPVVLNGYLGFRVVLAPR